MRIVGNLCRRGKDIYLDCCCTLLRERNSRAAVDDGPGTGSEFACLSASLFECKLHASVDVWVPFSLTENVPVRLACPEKSRLALEMRETSSQASLGEYRTHSCNSLCHEKHLCSPLNAAAPQIVGPVGIRHFYVS